MGSILLLCWGLLGSLFPIIIIIIMGIMLLSPLSLSIIVIMSMGIIMLLWPGCWLPIIIIIIIGIMSLSPSFLFIIMPIIIIMVGSIPCAGSVGGAPPNWA